MIYCNEIVFFILIMFIFFLEYVMLILTRRVGETLMVGDEITVTVLGIKGNQIRLGVNAPKDISVHREEIYQKIQVEKSKK